MLRAPAGQHRDGLAVVNQGKSRLIKVNPVGNSECGVRNWRRLAGTARSTTGRRSWLIKANQGDSRLGGGGLSDGRAWSGLAGLSKREESRLDGVSALPLRVNRFCPRPPVWGLSRQIKVDQGWRKVNYQIVRPKIGLGMAEGRRGLLLRDWVLFRAERCSAHQPVDIGFGDGFVVVNQGKSRLAGGGFSNYSIEDYQTGELGGITEQRCGPAFNVAMGWEF
jgi:hypothetical protein